MKTLLKQISMVWQHKLQGQLETRRGKSLSLKRNMNFAHFSMYCLESQHVLKENLRAQQKPLSVL
jgi:hypothetical protein